MFRLTPDMIFGLPTHLQPFQSEKFDFDINFTIEPLTMKN